MVLAKIDTEANPQVAAAFQVQSIPAVFLILNGQVQQLFNGAYPEPQVRSVLEQVLDVAAKTFGQEVASPNLLAEPEAEPEKPIDPRFVKAFDAMEAGEWDTAEVVFKEALLNAPADEEAKIGVIQVGLFKRTDGVDFDKVIGKSLDNHETYLEVADSLMMLGQLNAALDLLISGIKNFAGEERDEIKQRLLDFFVLIGDSEEVRTARRNLTNALF
jgi:putative thioredoxin